MVHVDFLNMDKSINTDGDITITLFECLVLVSIFVGFIYMSCGACGQLRTVYNLKRHERSQTKREKIVVNLRELLKKEMQADAEQVGSSAGNNF